MKIAVAGKGGVGKTTLVSLLARTFAREGRSVLAIDADPDANLASALGVPEDLRAGLQPISKMKALARERTGHGGGFGGLFKLNPTVHDLPDILSIEHEGVRVLALGTIERGGSGCACPEHTLLRALMNHILVGDTDIVLMDMEAGVEHLGRATADGVDLLIVVVEPGQRSLDTANHIERLASDIGLECLAYVGSKVRSEDDRNFLRQALSARAFLGWLTWSSALQEADRRGGSPFDVCPETVQEVDQIRRRIPMARGPGKEPWPCV